MPKSGNRDYQHKALTISKKVSALALIPGPERREPGAKSRRKLEIKINIITISEKKTKRLGAYSRIEMREPEAKSRRNLVIAITSIRH